MNKIALEPVLCFVYKPWAYFTTQELDAQRGDDWTRKGYQNHLVAPYNVCWHNEPFARNDPNCRRGYRPGTKELYAVGELCRCETCLKDWNDDGTQKWELIKIAFEGDFDAPCDKCSDFSAQEINAGACAWLIQPYASKNPPVIIPAGTTISRFKELVRQVGGNIYERTDK